MDQRINDEKTLQFKQFTHAKALQFGLAAVSHVVENHKRRIGVRITYKGLLVFQYLMDDKNEDMWLKRKENTVMTTGHSGMYVFEHADEYKDLEDNDNYAICGGGFPIIEDGGVVGAICVSGMAHDEDHQLIVDTLKTLLEGEDK